MYDFRPKDNQDKIHMETECRYHLTFANTVIIVQGCLMGRRTRMDVGAFHMIKVLGNRGDSCTR